MKRSGNISAFEKARVVGSIRKAKKLRDELESDIEEKMAVCDAEVVKKPPAELAILEDQVDHLIDGYCKVCDLLDVLETEWKKNRYAMD